MNILTVNKYYYIKGGSETYLFSLQEQLEKRGHHVIPFSMEDERNNQTPYDQYFVKNIDYSKAGFLEKMKLASKIIFSLEAKKNMDRLLSENVVDIAHLHLFQHQLSPSLLIPLKKRGIPVIYTVHDLKVMCPNYKMLNQNGVCEKCKDGKYYNAVINRCTKNSISGSVISMMEAYIHRGLKVYEKYIDHFITPSYFYKKKMIEWGFQENKISFIPNFLDTTRFTPNYSHDRYMLYLGRLSEEKGVLTLIEAMKRCKTEFKLKIVGTGPIRNQIDDAIKSSGLEDSIELLGFKSGIELTQLVQNSKSVVMPSEWYENGPLALIETLAYGKPVIGSDIGGIPEHIDDGENGMLFKKGDAANLALKLDEMNELNEQDYMRLCRNARQKAESLYDAKQHLENITRVYEIFRPNKSAII